jgi:predicted nucleic acid-binding Zn ribbon protein
MYYLYKCKECGFEETFEYGMMETQPKVITCPQCTKKAMKNVITGGAGVIYKAHGFSKSKVDSSRAVKTTTKIAYNQKALEQYRERNSS